MDLGVIIPCEITQRKTSTIWYHLYAESKTQTKQNKTKKRLIGTENKLVATRRERVRVWGKQVYGIRRYKSPILQ